VLDYVSARLWRLCAARPALHAANLPAVLTPPLLVLGTGGLLIMRARRRRPEQVLPALTQDEKHERNSCWATPDDLVRIMRGAAHCRALVALLRPLMREPGIRSG